MSNSNFDRLQYQYDRQLPEDRPLCEGICGGDVDEHFTQHGDEDARNYCADCREGAAACARYDLNESEPDDDIMYAAHLLRHRG